jgi:RNA polymerase sigma factor (sigma-70 family)
MANLRSWIGLGEKEGRAVHFHHPGVELDNKERAAILFRAMQKLPENQRIAFTLIKAEGLSYEETADIMNVTVKAVEALMHRAKDNLKKHLQQYYQP